MAEIIDTSDQDPIVWADDTFDHYGFEEGESLKISEGYVRVSNDEFKFRFRVAGEDISGKGSNEGSYLRKDIDLAGATLYNKGTLRELLDTKRYFAYSTDQSRFYIDFKNSDGSEPTGWVIVPTYVNLDRDGARGDSSVSVA